MEYLVTGKYPDGSGKVVMTPREQEISELSAWGLSRKEIADKLFVSEHTVENHFRNIFKKTGCKKLNQLSAWWFCIKFNISFDLSPRTRSIIASLLLSVYSSTIFTTDPSLYTRRILRRNTIELRIREV